MLTAILTAMGILWKIDIIVFFFLFVAFYKKKKVHDMVADVIKYKNLIFKKEIFKEEDAHMAL